MRTGVTGMSHIFSFSFDYITSTFWLRLEISSTLGWQSWRWFAYDGYCGWTQGNNLHVLSLKCSHVFEWWTIRSTGFHTLKPHSLYQVNKTSPSCVRTASPKLWTSLEQLIWQLVTSLTEISEFSQGCPNNFVVTRLSQSWQHKTILFYHDISLVVW